MNALAAPSVVAFAGTDLIASGSLSEVALAAKSALESGTGYAVLLFDAITSEQLEVDFRGSADDVLGRLPSAPMLELAPDAPATGADGAGVAGAGAAADGAAAGSASGSAVAGAAVVDSPATDAPPAPRSPGRPKLGVVAREVTLLPRHWEWLAAQPGSASVTLRKLVEAARKASTDADLMREARDATYRFTLVMAGNEVGFEEATRALYAGDRERFEYHIASWPANVRDHALSVSAHAFPAFPA